MAELQLRQVHSSAGASPKQRGALESLKPYWAQFDRYRPILRNLKIAAREAELETLARQMREAALRSSLRDLL